MRSFALLLLVQSACAIDNPGFGGATDPSTGTTTSVSATATGNAPSTSTSTANSTSTSPSIPTPTSPSTTTSATTSGSDSESSGQLSSSSSGCVDGDGDDVCDTEDNCPELANFDQLDGDGDGRGDVCDVCNTPDFDDDNADYDQDGLPCAVDPCPHDGPTPPSYPPSVGPVDEFTITGATLNDAGSFISVGPGETVNLKYSWTANFCTCPGCKVQAMVGLYDQPPSQCFYDKGSEANCQPWSGEEQQVFTAPAAPGLYRFRSARTWDYYCKTEDSLAGPESEFAAICVK